MGEREGKRRKKGEIFGGLWWFFFLRIFRGFLDRRMHVCAAGEGEFLASSRINLMLSRNELEYKGFCCHPPSSPLFAVHRRPSLSSWYHFSSDLSSVFFFFYFVNWHFFMSIMCCPVGFGIWYCLVLLKLGFFWYKKIDLWCFFLKKKLFGVNWFDLIARNEKAVLLFLTSCLH